MCATLRELTPSAIMDFGSPWAVLTSERKMTVCVYPTDGNWISILHENKIKNNVNFWVGDKKAVHLKPRTCFYFKIRGSVKIAGRGYFREKK